MKWLRHWKIAVALVAIFLLGVVTGALFTLGRVRKHADQYKSPEKLCAEIMKGAVSSLKLTPQQVEKIHLIVSQATVAMHQQQRDFYLMLHKLISETEDKASVVLTPEQKTLIQKNHEQRTRKMEPWLKSGENTSTK